jgi:hypothetical protein
MNSPTIFIKSKLAHQSQKSLQHDIGVPQPGTIELTNFPVSETRWELCRSSGLPYRRENIVSAKGVYFRSFFYLGPELFAIYSTLTE